MAESISWAPIILVGGDAQVSAPQLPRALLDLQLYCNKGLCAACKEGLHTAIRGFTTLLVAAL